MTQARVTKTLHDSKQLGGRLCSCCLLHPLLSPKGRKSKMIDCRSVDEQRAQRKLELYQDLHSRTFMTL